MYSQLKVEQTLFQCMQVKQRAEKQRVQDLVLEVAQQKDQIAAAMKAVSSFYQKNEVGAGSYKPKRKRKKSTSLANGQEKSNIFFPSGLGDKDELMKAQEYAKKSLQRKSTTVNTSNNERGCDSQDADDNSSILDAVSGMITLSRRGSSTDNV